MGMISSEDADYARTGCPVASPGPPHSSCLHGPHAMSPKVSCQFNQKAPKRDLSAVRQIVRPPQGNLFSSAMPLMTAQVFLFSQ